jgi:hypothetical protein
MDKFVKTILGKITREGCSLSIVQNTDGFLSRVDTQEAFIREAGVTLLPGSPLALRVHYERWYKGCGERFCYIVNDLDEILPDMKANAFCCVFSVSDVLWGYDKTELLKWNAPFSVLHHLFEKKQNCYLNALQTREEMGYVAEEIPIYDIERISENIRSIELDWLSADSMEKVCRFILSAISKRMYGQVEFLVNEINQQFQTFMNENYKGLLTKSHLKRPYSVNNVLKHINAAHPDAHDKIALFVIDGMSYWQYLMLKDALKDKNIETDDNITYAWVPSITKLSRQALFRGDMPKESYVQSPPNESKLWFDYWGKKHIPHPAIWYEHDGTIDHPEQYTKVGYVTTSIDHHMHGCRDLKDLYDLTANRIIEIVDEIKNLYEAGFTIYVTADHGNVYSHSWRALNPQEKAVLYTNESRGGRHLIFTKEEYLQYFFQQNPQIENEMLVRENYAVWRDANCFKGADEVTHGGCHFLEMIVPFAKIEKKSSWEK